MANVQITEIGSHHIKISWMPPRQVNGVLKGYYTGIKVPPPSMNRLVQTFVDKSTEHQFEGLQNDTKYFLYVWASTKAGKGPPKVVEVFTNPLQGMKELIYFNFLVNFYF